MQARKRCIRDQSAVEFDRAGCIVVAWDWEVDAVNRAVGVDNRNDRNPKFFGFFQAQALLTAVFAVPFLVVALAPERPPLGALIAAVVIWLAAVSGETWADRQLAVWRADPTHRGRTCRTGLWRYSRHPNYFFEWLHWWSYPLLAWGAPEWWLTLLGPALMLYTLLKVTGIPYTEQQALASRGDDYRAYQRSTSAFIPWWPKPEDGV